MIKCGTFMRKNFSDYLTPLLIRAPASWALIRANEIRNLETVKFIPPILDVGCGDGFVTRVLINGKKQKFDWGVDLSAKEISYAKKSGSYKKCQVANVYALPFEDGTFQTVFSNSVIEHIPDLELALFEMFRVLKKRGQLIITIPTPFLAKYLMGTNFFRSLKMDFLAEFYGKSFNSLFRHYNLHTHREWEKILKRNSLKLVDHKYYHTPGMVKVHEILAYLAIPNHLLKLLLGHWVVFPKIRKILIVPWLKKLLWRFYIADTCKDEGGSLLIIAQKV